MILKFTKTQRQYSNITSIDELVRLVESEFKESLSVIYRNGEIFQASFSQHESEMRCGHYRTMVTVESDTTDMLTYAMFALKAMFDNPHPYAIIVDSKIEITDFDESLIDMSLIKIDHSSYSMSQGVGYCNKLMIESNYLTRSLIDDLYYLKNVRLNTTNHEIIIDKIAHYLYDLSKERLVLFSNDTNDMWKIHRKDYNRLAKKLKSALSINEANSLRYINTNLQFVYFNKHDMIQEAIKLGTLDQVTSVLNELHEIVENYVINVKQI